MAKVNFCQVLYDRKGEPFEERDPKLSTRENPVMRPITLGTLGVNALEAVLEGDPKEKLTEKLRRWDLIRAITRSEEEFGPVELLDTDVVMLRERIGKMPWPVSFIGSAIDALKPVEEKA